MTQILVKLIIYSFKLSPSFCTLCFLGWWHQAKRWFLPIWSHKPLGESTIQIQGDRHGGRGSEAACPPSHQLGGIWGEQRVDRQRRGGRVCQAVAAAQAKAPEWWKLVVCSSKNTHPLVHLFILGVFANYCLPASPQDRELWRSLRSLKTCSVVAIHSCEKATTTNQDQHKGSDSSACVTFRCSELFPSGLGTKKSNAANKINFHLLYFGITCSLLGFQRKRRYSHVKNINCTSSLRVGFY